MVEKTRGLVARTWRGLLLLTAVVCLPLHAATINVPADFPTIGAAITAAASGDTIQVAAGTYTEQLVITKNLTISGAGSGTTTIQAPNLIVDPTLAERTIVAVSGVVTVTISGFTIQGPGTACSVAYGMVAYLGATLISNNNHVTLIGNIPIDSLQCGTAIRAGFPGAGGVVANLTVTNTQIDLYQKNGIRIDGAGSTATITASTVTGNGATTAIAQNGIVVTNGAAATITGNTVSGNDCDEASCSSDPTLDQSAGILIFSAGSATMSGNTVTGNDTGINVFDTATAATSSSDTLTGNRYENIFVEAGTLSVQGGVVGPTSNFAIYALSRAGNARNSTVVVEDCLSSITGPQLANTVAGSSFTASIALGTCGTKTVTGQFTPGSLVTYTITLNNSGSVAVSDDLSIDEFTDVLPAALTLVNAISDSGTALATIGTNTVTWNGAIAAAASVTITITATLSAAATPGATVDNQGNIATDLNGDGINDVGRATGATAGTEGLTTFTVAVATAVRLQSFDVE